MDAKGRHFSTLGSCTLFSQDSPRKTKTIKLTQEVIKNLNRHTSKETELVAKLLSQRKAQEQIDLLVNSIRHLKKN